MRLILTPENQERVAISFVCCLMMILIVLGIQHHNYYPLFIYMVFLYPYLMIMIKWVIESIQKWWLLRRIRHQICRRILYQDVWCVEKQISEDCTICMEKFDAREEIVMLPCGCFQPYHPKCILTWLEKNASCPLCRKDLLSIEKNEEKRSLLS